ncbi:MAG: hypothetical protein LW860_18305, partial [Xanthomonadaceae bacterium]|nr:hypothetical protein [Xanthomonadaceae bacterium]
MSLILEALRKSEQQRRLGEVPTLGSESAWATRRWHGAPSRAARWPWLLAAVLLVGAAAAWWWLRRDAAPSPVAAETATDAVPPSTAPEALPAATAADPPAPTAGATAP